MLRLPEEVGTEDDDLFGMRVLGECVCTLRCDGLCVCSLVMVCMQMIVGDVHVCVVWVVMCIVT